MDEERVGNLIYLLFFMEQATRRVHFAGLTANPDEGWMLQVARNLTDAEGGFLRGKKYLLMDRDAKFSEAFRVTLEQGGVEAVRLPPRSPNLSPHIERFMRSAKEECLDAHDLLRGEIPRDHHSRVPETLSC